MGEVLLWSIFSHWILNEAFIWSNIYQHRQWIQFKSGINKIGKVHSFNINLEIQIRLREGGQRRKTYFKDFYSYFSFILFSCPRRPLPFCSSLFIFACLALIIILLQHFNEYRKFVCFRTPKQFPPIDEFHLDSNTTVTMKADSCAVSMNSFNARLITIGLSQKYSHKYCALLRKAIN